MERLIVLLQKAKTSSFYLWLLNCVLWKVIPFNKPHKFKVLTIGEDTIETGARYRKGNFNHIRGIHACGIATIAEFAAGLLLIMKFNPTRYRLIMSELKVDYHFQAKKDIKARAQMDPSTYEQLQATLQSEDAVLQIMCSEMYDVDGQHIATAYTTWQIKPWTKVRTQK